MSTTAAAPWRNGAACALPQYAAHQDLWFPLTNDPEILLAARKICMLCAVSAECLDDALTYEQGRGRRNRFGIRAGTTPAQRYHLARKARQQQQREAA